MENIILAQASGYKPEVVGQRTIISEEELQARSESPELSSMVSFLYVILAIALLIAAGWAIRKLFLEEPEKPKAPRKVPSRPKVIRSRKTTKS